MLCFYVKYVYISSKNQWGGSSNEALSNNNTWSKTYEFFVNYHYSQQSKSTLLEKHDTKCIFKHLIHRFLTSWMGIKKSDFVH